jgi:hypothetical protein
MADGSAVCVVCGARTFDQIPTSLPTALPPPQISIRPPSGPKPVKVPRPTQFKGDQLASPGGSQRNTTTEGRIETGHQDLRSRWRQLAPLMVMSAALVVGLYVSGALYSFAPSLYPGSVESSPVVLGGTVIVCIVILVLPLNELGASATGLRAAIVLAGVVAAGAGWLTRRDCVTPFVVWDSGWLLVDLAPIALGGAVGRLTFRRQDRAGTRALLTAAVFAIAAAAITADHLMESARYCVD